MEPNVNTRIRQESKGKEKEKEFIVHLTMDHSRLIRVRESSLPEVWGWAESGGRYSSALCPSQWPSRQSLLGGLGYTCVPAQQCPFTTHWAPQLPLHPSVVIQEEMPGRRSSLYSSSRGRAEWGRLSVRWPLRLSAVILSEESMKYEAAPHPLIVTHGACHWNNYRV